MSEHIHADTVQPGGSVGPVSNRRAYRTAQIKPATRNAVKDILASAADNIERLIRERDCWRELAEREPQVDEDATPFPALALLAIGGAIGTLATALAGWLL